MGTKPIREKSNQPILIQLRPYLILGTCSVVYEGNKQNQDNSVKKKTQLVCYLALQSMEFNS